MTTRLAFGAAIFLLMLAGNLAFSREAGAAAQSSLTAPKPAAAIVANGAWTTYHHDNAHTGYDSSAPAATGSIGPTPGWTEAALDGEVYAEPLVYNNLVYTATLNNTVYAINQATGDGEEQQAHHS